MDRQLMRAIRAGHEAIIKLLRSANAAAEDAVERSPASAI